jgi:MFS family permease
LAVPDSGPRDLTLVRSPPPLMRPDYRRFWIGLAVASIGFWVHNVAATWLMKDWSDGDPVMISLIQSSISFPVMVMALPAGVLADMFDRRRFLVFSQMWMFSLAAGVGLAVAFSMHNPWLLIVFTAALGFGHAMKVPSQASIVPELAGREHIAAAVSLGSMAVNGARVVGPALAGVLLVALGPRDTFFVAASGFLVYAAIMLAWRRPLQRPRIRGQSTVDVALGGIRFAAGSPPFRATLIRCALFFLVWTTVLTVLPNIIHDVGVFGQVYACFGIGGVAGALTYPFADKRISREVLLALGVGLQAIGLAALAVAGHPAVMGAVLIVTGFASMWGMISIQTTAQLMLPEDLRARGMSMVNFTMMGASTVGAPIWGAVVKYWSPEISLLAAATFSLVALAATARMRVSEAPRRD